MRRRLRALFLLFTFSEYTPARRGLFFDFRGRCRHGQRLFDVHQFRFFGTIRINLAGIRHRMPGQCLLQSPAFSFEVTFLVVNLFLPVPASRHFFTSSPIESRGCTRGLSEKLHRLDFEQKNHAGQQRRRGHDGRPHVTQEPNEQLIGNQVRVQVVDTRANLLQAERLVSGDKYIFIRNAYLQSREFKVKDGQVEDDF